MTDFITVEDINSTLKKYGNVNTLHKIDTSKVGVDEFADVMYDFCIITHSISGDMHNFSFEVRNSLWCGGYYFTDANGDYLDINASGLNNRTISVSTEESEIILVLYLTNLYTVFDFKRLTWFSNDLNNFHSFYEYNTLPMFDILNFDGSTPTGIVRFEYDNEYADALIVDGSVEYTPIEEWSAGSEVKTIKVIYNHCYYYSQMKIIKNIVPVLINQELIVGKINRVHLKIPDDVMYWGDIEEANVYYKDKIIPVEHSDGYYFDLDLTGMLKTGTVDFTVRVTETENFNGYDFDYSLNCVYCTVDNFEDLVLELNSRGGSRIINVVEDIDFSSDILITHDVKIIGADCTFNLNKHSITIKEDVSLKIEHVRFDMGDPAIIQELNSKLDANNCIFTNCTATDYNNLGSVILCDIDLESISVDEDFVTNLIACTFINNHSCILHGGTLFVDNCKYLNNNIEYLDKNNTAFLYQTDGEAIIQNSVFDIDYDTSTLCENERNIGFAQALFKCGLNAQINSATHDYLSRDDNLIFFDNPYNNRAHIYSRYYYPKIESCVISSPHLGFEDKCLCYSVSGVNWVFKKNVEITRLDSGKENTIRKIEWG